MKYIGENAIKKLIALIKGDLAKKQNSITVSGLLKGNGTTISAAVAEIDYMAPPTGGTTGQILKKTETGTEWADSDVFIATYGTTTSAEIEAAYQAGKILYCETGDWIGQYANRISSSQFVFIFNRPEAIYTATVSTSSITGVTTWTNEQISYTPKTHASTHASGGSDPITPADIGAATMDEVNAAIQAAIGNAIGGSY